MIHIHYHDEFKESEHPRGGHPENPGEFSKGAGGAKKVSPAGKKVPTKTTKKVGKLLDDYGFNYTETARGSDIYDNGKGFKLRIKPDQWSMSKDGKFFTQSMYLNEEQVTEELEGILKKYFKMGKEGVARNKQKAEKALTDLGFKEKAPGNWYKARTDKEYHAGFKVDSEGRIIKVDPYEFEETALHSGVVDPDELAEHYHEKYAQRSGKKMPLSRLDKLASAKVATFGLYDGLYSWAPLTKTQAEDDALDSYGADSDPILDKCRNGDYEDKEVVAIHDYLQRAEIPVDLTVYRGVAGDFAKKILKSGVGTAWQEKGFMSTSVNQETSEFFAGDQVLMKFKVPKGTKGGAATADGGDLEVLFDYGVRLKVTKLTKNYEGLSGETYTLAECELVSGPSKVTDAIRVTDMLPGKPSGNPSRFVASDLSLVKFDNDTETEDKAFDPAKHPRGGKAENPGEFSEAPGSSESPKKKTQTYSTGAGHVSFSNIGLKPTKQRAWSGQTNRDIKNKLGKQAAGKFGEQLALSYLIHHLGLDDANPLNTKAANYPVDMHGGDHVYEVKTGQASNTKSAAQWRATIGEPGDEETEELTNMTKEEKAAHNQAKALAIMERKQRALQEVSQEVGRQLKPRTLTMILDHDRGIADMYMFDGFHSRIGYNSPLARSGYVGSFTYTGGGSTSGESNVTKGKAKDHSGNRRLGGTIQRVTKGVVVWLH